MTINKVLLLRTGKETFEYIPGQECLTTSKRCSSVIFPTAKAPIISRVAEFGIKSGEDSHCTV